MHFPTQHSAAVFVFVRRGAVEIRILGACDTAASIVGSGLHLHPRVAHHALDSPEGDWTVLATLFFPVVEKRVVQWTQALGSIRREEDDVFDGLRAAVAKGLADGVEIPVNRSAIEDECQRVAVEPLHCLSEYVIDELQQHRAIDSLHFCISTLFGREDLGQEHAVANAACDHVESLAVGRSLLSNDVRLLARQHDGGVRSSAEAESSLIEKDDSVAALVAELAAKGSDLLTQGRIHCRGK